MTSKYFPVIVLFTFYSAQGMEIQKFSKKIENLETPITFQNVTKSIYKWIRDDRNGAFGYTHYYEYNNNNKEKSFIKLGTVKTLEIFQLDNIASGGCFYCDSLKQKTIDNHTMEIGAIIQADNKNIVLTDDTSRTLQRLHLIDTLRGNPHKKIQRSLHVKKAKIENDFIMLMAPMMMLVIKNPSKTELETPSTDDSKKESGLIHQFAKKLSKIEDFSKIEPETVLKDFCEATARELLKEMDTEKYEDFVKQRNNFFGTKIVKILGFPLPTPNPDNDPLENTFITEIMPSMMLFNKKGFSKEDYEVFVRQFWKNDTTFQKEFGELIALRASTSLPALTVSTASIISPDTTATTSTCSTNTTAEIASSGNNSPALITLPNATATTTACSIV